MKTLVLLLAMTISIFCETKYVEAPLEFTNTPLKLAIETVFLKAGVKYSIEKELTHYGNVTLTITQKQDLDTILNLILEPKNLRFKVDADKVYHIGYFIDHEYCGGNRKVTKLYPLTYVLAGDISRAMKGVLTLDGVVAVDITLNSLIITDVPEVFEGIESLLKEIDIPRCDPDIQVGLLFIRSDFLENGGTLPCFLKVKELIKAGKLNDSYMFELRSKENAVTDGEFVMKNSKVNAKYSAFFTRDGYIKLSFDISLAGNEILPVVNKIKTEISIKNGETYPVIKANSDGRNYCLYVIATRKDYAQPRCQNTPWISQYEIKVPGETDVLVDWKLDLPFGANGISHYRAYRDTKPIWDVKNMKPIQDFIEGGSTSWMDLTPKDRNRTYYYVVTAVNASGMEQAIDRTGRSNAVITIPER